MANSWFRLYSEFADDPKVQMLPEAMQRRLVMLFCERCKEETLHETERAFHWRISEQELAETKALFLAKGFIEEDWTVINWNRRQFLSDSSTDRVRRFRSTLKQDETLHETVCNVTETKGNATVTPPDTDTDSEADTEQIQKPSRVKRERTSDDRHMSFKSAIASYWEAKNPGIQMPWGPMEGKQLGMWLREAPHITLEQFTGFLRARFKSDVNHSDRPSQWIRWITSYGSGPIDRFNKPMPTEGSNGTSKQSDTHKRVDSARRALAEIAIQRGLIDPTRFAGDPDSPVPEPGLDGRDRGVHEGLRSAGPEILPPRSATGNRGFTH